MVLSAVIPESWMYGFVSVVFTHDPFVGPAIYLVLWLALAWITKHRLDPPDAQIHVHISEQAALWSGVLVGAVLVAVLRTPQLLEFRPFRTESGKGRRSAARPGLYPFNFLFLLAVVVTVAGTYGLEDEWEGVLSFGARTAMGVVLIVLGVLLLLYAAVQMFRLPRTDDRLDFKYVWPFALLLTTPAIYDYPVLVAPEFRPWQGLILLAVVLLLYVAFYFYAKGVRAGGVGDALYGDARASCRWTLWVGATHLATYGAAWAVDEATGGADVVAVLIAVLAASVAAWLVLAAYAVLSARAAGVVDEPLVRKRVDGRHS